jgi:hypothetical protein
MQRRKQGDEPYGESLWVETSYNAYLLLQPPHVTKRRTSLQLTAARKVLACTPRSHLRLQTAFTPSVTPVIWKENLVPYSKSQTCIVQAQIEFA